VRRVLLLTTLLIQFLFVHNLLIQDVKVMKKNDQSGRNKWDRYFDRLNSVAPEIFRILKNAVSMETARERVFFYVNQLDRELHEGIWKLHPLEWANSLECLQVFKGTLSKRNERLTGESSLKYLWMIARKDPRLDLSTIHEGFIEEFHHLLRGMHGHSGLYNVRNLPAFLHYEDRKSALLRSDNLDEISGWANKYIEKYISGLDDDVIKIRKKNALKIRKFFKGSMDDWNDWHWQMRHLIRDAETLASLINIPENEKESIKLAAKNKIPFGITPYYLSLIDSEQDAGYDRSLRSQVIPPLDYVLYMTEHRDEYALDCDFMLERDTSPIDLVTRRYPKVAIFKPYNTCPQICVYCQRNWEIEEVNAPHALASREKIDAAIEWFEKHPHVTEVLITGGDPFSLANDHLEYFLRRFSAMPHIDRIRFGTRTLVTIPQRITDKLVSLIRRFNDPMKLEICIITHFQHVSEITPDAFHAVRKIRDAGISIYNQLVYTFYASRRFESMALRILLKRIGVDPYYTFNMKGKQEMAQYRVPIARLLQERREETRLFPGTVRLDEPVYNVPRLGKNYLKAWQNHEVIMITPRGTRIYEFHPWEKNINPMDTYISEDVSILEYLQALKKSGENLNDYKSIWYYF
jgi:lysine 2,3-aminomutase